MRLQDHKHCNDQVAHRGWERRNEGISDFDLEAMKEEAQRAIFNYRKPEVRPELILQLITRLEATENELRLCGEVPVNDA